MKRYLRIAQPGRPVQFIPADSPLSVALDCFGDGTYVTECELTEEEALSCNRIAWRAVIDQRGAS